MTVLPHVYKETHAYLEINDLITSHIPEFSYPLNIFLPSFELPGKIFMDEEAMTPLSCFEKSAWSRKSLIEVFISST